MFLLADVASCSPSPTPIPHFRGLLTARSSQHSSAVTVDVQPPDSRYGQDTERAESAGPSADVAPIEGSERESATVPTIPAVNVSAAAHIMAEAASSSLASVPAGTPVALLSALIGQVGGASIGSQISTSPPLGVQFFQALGRWMSGPADTVVPTTVGDSFARVLAGQLLPVPPMPDNLDSLNWDEVSSDLDNQGARTLVDCCDPDGRRLPPAARSLADAERCDGSDRRGRVESRKENGRTTGRTVPAMAFAGF